MLVELRVRGYAVIDDLTVNLEPGLNVLSGETGAGKSLIVGALSLLLGGRASSQVVRAGSERAVVEAVFDLDGASGLSLWLEERGLPDNDGFLILRREVAAAGRNRAWINGSPVSASLVGEAGTRLVDIHGQHEHQSLLKVRNQRGILDLFGGAEELAAEVQAHFSDMVRVRTEVQEKEVRIRELEARADFLRFQWEEIEEAKVQPGEEDSLLEEARRLEHAGDLAAGAEGLHQQLYGGEDSLSDRISALQRTLDRLASVDESLSSFSSSFREAYHLLSETGQALGSYASRIEHDPLRLEQIRARLDLLFRLKRKYGPELADVLETGRRLKKELAELENAEIDLEGLNQELRDLENLFLGKALVLSDRRREAAQRIGREVEAQLPDLGMAQGRFHVTLEDLPEPGGGGRERVEFRVSLNPGFDLGPLSKVVSGGELSRVMLALKTTLASVDQIPTLVFDEIDAGIGGQVAVEVASKLRDVASHHQVLVITHLPQLASKAHHQLTVEKLEEDGQVATEIRSLAGEERVREVARMLGGDPESTASRDHARELLGLEP